MPEKFLPNTNQTTNRWNAQALSKSASSAKTKLVTTWWQSARFAQKQSSFSTATIAVRRIRSQSRAVKWKMKTNFPYSLVQLICKKMKCCQKCGTKFNLTRHHVYPKKWNKFDDKKFHSSIREYTIVLCRRDHDKIERILWVLHEAYGRLPEKVYLTLANNF